MALASDDDGVHADYMLTLGAESGADDDFTIDISYSYEGIEASVINVLSGTTYLYSTDDGVNAAGDYQEGATLSEVSENVSLMAGPGGSFGGWNNNGGSGNSSPGWGSDDSSDHGMLYIKGGRLYCEVNGDGLDSNGSIAMSGGTVIVNGPTSSGNGVFDKGDNNSDTFTLTGGTLIGVGTSDMAVYPTVSGQGYYSGTTSSSSGGWGGWGGQSGSSSSSSVTKGTAIKLTTDSGYVVVIPKVTVSSGFIYISTPDMTSGKSYSLSSDTSYSDGEQVFGKTENGTFYGLIEKKN
jgi:hypothetical protein